MKLVNKLRHYWHEVYYSIMSQNGIEFAMRCKDVTAHIDLKERPKGMIGHLRFWLHLSLCQACDNYMKLSIALGKQIRDYAKFLNSKSKLEDMNKILIEKYSKK